MNNNNQNPADVVDVAEVLGMQDCTQGLTEEQNAHLEEGFYVPEVDELADVAGDFHHFVERFWL
ncbi:MAG: hypothetical protein IAF58_03145 [Leptolyngbya sp.]|nr:hypothetical protein [Candidatus Melainabacteria bacterium]